MKSIIKYIIILVIGVVIGGVIIRFVVIPPKHMEKTNARETTDVPHERSGYSERSTHSKQVEEWLKFRNNEDTYKGTIVTWRFKVAYITKECPLGYLEDFDYHVVVSGVRSCTYQAASLMGYLPRVRQDDWIVVRGKLDYVSSDGVVVLEPLEVRNEGYKP